MPKIVIEIENCKGCPYFYTDNQRSSDGWDRMEDWNCKKEKRKIEGAVEWHEESKIKIPNWCPIVVIESIEDI
jgi:hypothetical protein